MGFTDGRFSDDCVVGQDHVVPYPDNLIPSDVAALTQPIAVAWHAVRTSKLKPVQLALVLGSCPIGLAKIIALKGHQTGKIVVREPALDRRLLAEKLGVETFNPKEYSTGENANALKAMSDDGFGIIVMIVQDCSGLSVTFNASVHLLHLTLLRVLPFGYINQLTSIPWMSHTKRRPLLVLFLLPFLILDNL